MLRTGCFCIGPGIDFRSAVLVLGPYEPLSNTAEIESTPNSYTLFAFDYTFISDVYIEDITPEVCDCTTSKFRYDPCSHITTGNLKIAGDR